MAFRVESLGSGFRVLTVMVAEISFPFLRSVFTSIFCGERVVVIGNERGWREEREEREGGG